MTRWLIVGLLAIGCSPGPPDASIDSGTLDSGWLDAGSDDGGFRSLFSGVDLSGWQKYLGAPSDGGAPLGIDNDPTGVFSVDTVDGEPAIHVTGEIWGELISNDFYGDFELEAEFKWGTHVWPPLNFFDSGIMYLSHGPYGATNAGGMALSNPIGSGAFLVSIEYQITPGDVGDLFDLGPIAFTAGGHMPGPESTDGGWNLVRIVHQNDSATHFLNDVQVASATGFTDVWPGEATAPLTQGKLQLQSEGGEIWFRRVRLRTLP